APAVLEVEGLEASYGSFRVLSGVTLEVRPGEIVALLGPNGAGKTTLIRCIAGLLRPRAGAMRWEGRPLGQAEAHTVVERGVAVLREINRGGVSILLVEQNVHAALALAHRGYILEAGRVAAEGQGSVLLNDAHVRRAYLGPLAR